MKQAVDQSRSQQRRLTRPGGSDATGRDPCPLGARQPQGIGSRVTRA